MTFTLLTDVLFIMLGSAFGQDLEQAKIKGLKLEIDNKLYTAKELEGLSESDISTTSSEPEESSEEESEVEEQNIEHRTSVDQNKNIKKSKQQKTPSPGGMKTRSNKKKNTVRKL